jgi:hypothetical protein
LSQVVLPVLAVAAVYAAYRVLRGATPPPERLVRQWSERSRRAWAELIGASAIPALGVAGAILLGVNSARGGSKQLLWLDPVEKLSLLAFLLTALVVLVALNVRARLVDRYGSPESLWSTRRPIVWMTLVVAVASVPICVVVSGSFLPLLDAKVCTSQSEVTGVLIGEASNRTYIGETEKSGPLLVFSVPGSEISETFIGGSADKEPCPAPARTPG